MRRGNLLQRGKKAEKKTKFATSSNHTKLGSWVWRHFTKEEHPLTEIGDGKEEVVGHTIRAQCKYRNTHLAANLSANGTSSLMKHIEQSCKGYPGRDDEEKGARQGSAGARQGARQGLGGARQGSAGARQGARGGGSAGARQGARQGALGRGLDRGLNSSCHLRLYKEL
ncbi:hypothetical protein ACLB2K_037726 [Fragaria x ananassa]